jgi:hypothetical protein
MINLSPAAQVVLDAYMTNCGWLDGPLEDDYRCAVAVLRAAADQTIDAHDGFAGTRIRKKLLAIATELEKTQ